MRETQSSVWIAAGILLCLSIGMLATAHGADKVNLERLKRGEYLVRTSGCGDCHTPWKMGPNGPEQDSTRMLSGHPMDLVMPASPSPLGPWAISVSGTFTAWSGPWGVSYSKNITPDEETGIGNWTEENFVSTIRTGREMGKGRAILPPMPIPVYNNMTDEDLKSIYAYLRSIPALKNKVPDPVPPTSPSTGMK